MWDAIPKATQALTGNERAHYDMPGANATGDMILYRSGKQGFLLASYRPNRFLNGPEAQRSWAPPVTTNLPNDESNLNCGTLPAPDGRVYMLNNAVFRAKAQGGEAAVASDSHSGTLRFRDPVRLPIYAPICAPPPSLPYCMRRQPVAITIDAVLCVLTHIYAHCALSCVCLI